MGTKGILQFQCRPLTRFIKSVHQRQIFFKPSMINTTEFYCLIDTSLSDLDFRARSQFENNFKKSSSELIFLQIYCDLNEY